MVQGADKIALTMLDVLSYLDKIPVCVSYEADGKRINDFPFGETYAANSICPYHLLQKAKPADLCRRVLLLEQVTGIEPAYSAWEADVLPLNYTCAFPMGRAPAAVTA